jgi:ABC-type glycerol-3-phosphate transport system permease component
VRRAIPAQAVIIPIYLLITRLQLSWGDVTTIAIFSGLSALERCAVPAGA